MLDVLEWLLDLEGYSYLRLDGTTEVQDRIELVDRWAGDFGSAYMSQLFATIAPALGEQKLGRLW